jgi:uncharacterized membrane protein YkoI
MKQRHVTLVVVLVGAGLVLCIGAVATQQLTEDERSVSIAEAPDGVRAALLAAAQGGTTSEIEVETEDGQAVYEADMVIDGKEIEVRVAADGTMLGKEAGDEDDDADDENDDEEEEQVSLAEVPEAVNATILKQAGTGTIEEIEVGNENGQIIYEADAIIDGQEVEIKVAPDGTLLGKEVENEDEDD